jgi:phosphoadenosine phosphosulfate reductase family protein
MSIVARLDRSISAPVDKPTLRIVSFGAGVQSTVMLLMAAKRRFGPLPDAVIFADTGWEPRAVYEHLEWVTAELARLTNGTMPVYVVSAGNIKSDHLQGTNSTGQRFASMPLYTANGEGMGRRQCTKEYKIEPIRKRVRDLLGVEPGKRVPKGTAVEQWIGISTDELQRLKESRDKWCHHRWPLIEARMSRADCRIWFERNYPGQPLVKSACLGCPFRDNEMWRQIRDTDPVGFEDACDFDDAIRHNGATLRKMNSQQFVHRSGQPLRTADLDDTTTSDLFQGECEGACGV